MFTNNEELLTLERKINDAHSKLLSIDQQYFRVQKQCIAEKETIESLQNFKRDLEKAVKELTDMKEKRESEVALLNEEKRNLESDIEQSRKIFVDQHKTITEEKESHILRGTELRKKEELHAKVEANLLEREKSVIESERIAAEKHARIKAFKESL